MSASPELHRSPVALDQLFPRPPLPASQPFESPIRQLQLYQQQLLLPTDGPTIVESSGPAAAAVDQAAAADDDFSTPTGDAHRIPSAADSCACPPPAPRKPRPSAPAAPSCRRRLIEGELLRIHPEEVERLFGRTWTRTTATPAATETEAPHPASANAGGPAVLPAKKRKRCYAEAAGGVGTCKD